MICVLGKLVQDGRTTTRMSAEEHAHFLKLTGVVDGFDLGLGEQLALVEACNVILSTHTGFGLAALAVGTPWVTISGGRWPEYFFNGVPFHSVLPSPAFGAFSLYEPPPVLDDDEGEGPRQLHVSRTRFREDRDRILDAIETMASDGVDYDDAVVDHFRRLADLLGPRTDALFSIDMVHTHHVPDVRGPGRV